MPLLMIAPPGAGQGTQGSRIAAHSGIRHIATGDLLRSHVARRTDLGRGSFVPDAAVERTLPAGRVRPNRLRELVAA
ncbi:nucleoside monophosphate kinase [Dactylosporangium sp. NPDC005572]|uniref:nucleoside monophosphate kinase n=1 Tax=Dactylosporangium sp. NPDC005572 TaxID=3156889 RepID=UPI0033B7A510